MTAKRAGAQTREPHWTTDNAVWHGHRHIGANPNGRDFVAGDVHGMFTELERALEACEFDASRDRLLSVGDLIDRGPRSEDALAWLESGRIHAATLGNHEAMMIDALYGADEDARERAHALWRDCGGAWWDQSERSGPELGRWREALCALPLAITLDTVHGPVGIVHALPCPGPWSETVRRCGADDDTVRKRLLWGVLPIGEAQPNATGARSPDEPRTIIAGHFASHTPGENGRVVHIDTGAGLDVPLARVTLACVSAEPVTYHSSPAGDARVTTPPTADGDQDELAPAPWLVGAAMGALAQWWRRARGPKRSSTK